MQGMSDMSVGFIFLYLSALMKYLVNFKQCSLPNSELGKVAKIFTQDRIKVILQNCCNIILTGGLPVRMRAALFGSAIQII